MRYFFFLCLPVLLLAQMQTRTQVRMGTFVHITLDERHTAQATESFALIGRIETSLSNYDPAASLSLLNKNHRIAPEPFLSEALALSMEYYQQTQGYFDVTIGAISKELYHFGEARTYSPSKEALQKAHLDIHGIHLSKDAITTDKNISIDLGGMGKGYGADKVASYLQEQNITEGIIALSGDIRCLHRCELFLQSPYSEQTFAKIQSKHPQLSISTSGTYRRFATTKEEHHLINPKTATQGRAFVSVSLFTIADNAKIDAYATALSVMPKEKALDFLKNHKEIGFVIVDNNSNILYGNTKRLIELEWLPYSENASSKSSEANSSTKPAIAKSFIHPDTSNPKVIAK